MKQLALAFVTFMSLSVCGQTKITNDIYNVKTEKHVNIPGTRLYIIPPKNINIVAAFEYQDPGEKDSSALLVFDRLYANYNISASKFRKEDFEMTGNILDYKELKVNGFPAKYLHVQNKTSGKRSMILLFGDSTFYTLVSRDYALGEEKTGQPTLNAFKTIYYDKNLKISPLASAPFILDENKSVFKFSERVSGLFHYTVGGVVRSPSNDKPTVSLSVFYKEANQTPKSVSQMLLTALMNNGLTVKDIKNISTENVNGLPAYEVEIHGSWEEKNTILYHLICIKQETVVVIQGSTLSDFENNLREFKKLAKTIRIK